ncbi:universal stress protein [Salinimicrobium sp. CDJ15-81-2]|nr:universal stress protein [Salinimicrobium nanhaiense]
MKNILVLTDFSEAAEVASDQGLEIAKVLDTGITFLHLISTPVEWRKIPLEKENLYPETKAAIGEAKDKLAKLERKAKELNVEAHSSLVYNLGMGEIYTYINEENYELVIIGAHGKADEKKPVGTNTLRIAHKSPVPVLILKPGAKPNLRGKWVIVSDYLEKSSESLSLFMNIALKLDASVQLLYVNTPYYFLETSQINEKLDRYISKYSEMDLTYKIIDAFNEERGIESYVNISNCDGVGLIVHGHSGLNPAFRRSILEKVLNQIDLPVITLNADRQSPENNVPIH